MRTERGVLGAGLVACAMMLAFSGSMVLAEGLNPEGINPHAEAPRKRITLEQKKAAAEARKKKKNEIEARKAAQKESGKAAPGQEQAVTGNDPINSIK
jgi:hypothetical protein